MALDKQGNFSQQPSELPDVPSPSMTPDQIRAKWQTPLDELKTTVNNAFDKLNSTADGASGADNIGATGFDGTASTPQAMLEDLNTRKAEKGADWTGTWQGFSPSQVDQTIRDQVNTNTSQLADIAIDVKNYGAKGDGSNDDTTAIQNAINATPSGGTLYFPHGTYIVKSTLQINNSITVRGAGQYSTIILAVGCNAIKIGDVTSFGSVSNVKFERIEIALNVRYTTTTNTYIGITVDGSSSSEPQHHIYRDVYIDGFGTAFQSKYLWSSVFDNFRTGSCHLGIVAYGSSVNNVVTNSSIGVDGTSGSKGIYFPGDVASEGWVITNTLIDSAEISIHGVAITHVYINNCILDHVKLNAIIVQDNGTNFGGNWDISGCYIAMSGSSGDVAIKNLNNISNSQNRGCRIRGNDILVYSGSSCAYGIFMQGNQAINNIIESNMLLGFSTVDIRSIHGNNTIANNKCLLSPSSTNIYGGDIVVNNTGTVYYERSLTYTTIGKIKTTYDQAIPTSGTWNVGDICFNITPTVTGTAGSQYTTLGWRCTVAGTPGTWVEMRTLTGS